MDEDAAQILVLNILSLKRAFCDFHQLPRRCNKLIVIHKTSNAKKYIIEVHVAISRRFRTYDALSFTTAIIGR